MFSKSNYSNKWMNLWIIYLWDFTLTLVEFFFWTSFFDIPKFFCIFCLFLSLVLISNNDSYSFAKCFKLFESASTFFLAGCFFKVVYLVDIFTNFSLTLSWVTVDILQAIQCFMMPAATWWRFWACWSPWFVY